MSQAFNYRAQTQDGRVVTGIVQAESAEASRRILEQNHLIPIQVNAPKLLRDYLPFGRKITVKERALFGRQLSTMLEAGLTLSQGLRLLIRQYRPGRFRTILENVLHDIQEGFSFSAALAKHPDAFDSIFLSVVRSGEATGKLEIVLEQISTTMEKDVKTRGKIKGALLYPAFILSVMIIVVIIMLVQVIPNLIGVFAESGKQLPLSTRMLIYLSDIFRNQGLLILAAVIVTVLSVRAFLKTPGGTELLSKVILRTPVIKVVVEKSNMARLGRLLGLLLGAGLPLLEALRLISAAMSNKLYQHGLEDAVVMIERGSPLSVPIIENTVFPMMVGQMVSVGEQTGKMDEVMIRMAGYYDAEVDTLVSSISALIEPFVIVLLGFGVAWLVIAILLPIYQVTSSI